jgi:hypothetical protein
MMWGECVGFGELSMRNEYVGCRLLVLKKIERREGKIGFDIQVAFFL